VSEGQRSNRERDGDSARLRTTHPARWEVAERVELPDRFEDGSTCPPPSATGFPQHPHQDGP
jgi:hypothetical protein